MSWIVLKEGFNHNQEFYCSKLFILTITNYKCIIIISNHKNCKNHKGFWVSCYLIQSHCFVGCKALNFIHEYIMSNFHIYTDTYVTYIHIHAIYKYTKYLIWIYLIQ